MSVAGNCEFVCMLLGITFYWKSVLRNTNLHKFSFHTRNGRVSSPPSGLPFSDEAIEICFNEACFVTLEMNETIYLLFFFRPWVFTKIRSFIKFPIVQLIPSTADDCDEALWD